jgi:hypothetical protein
MIHGRKPVHGWTLECLFLWYKQWTPEEWSEYINATRYTRLDWALWWNDELRKAEDESDRLWRVVASNPQVFGYVTAQWACCTPRFHVTLQ